MIFLVSVCSSSYIFLNITKENETETNPFPVFPVRLELHLPFLPHIREKQHNTRHAQDRLSGWRKHYHDDDSLRSFRRNYGYDLYYSPEYDHIGHDCAQYYDQRYYHPFDDHDRTFGNHVNHSYDYCYTSDNDHSYDDDHYRHDCASYDHRSYDYFRNNRISGDHHRHDCAFDDYFRDYGY